VGIAYAIETTTEPELSLKDVVSGGQTVCDFNECTSRGDPVDVFGVAAELHLYSESSWVAVIVTTYGHAIATEVTTPLIEGSWL
jgi:hypothetical protein